MADLIATAARTVEAAAEAATGAVETIALGNAGGAPLPQLIPPPGPARVGYDRMVDAVNRLPRPLAALLVLALFLDAALDPAGFARRMAVMNQVPEPLWWLMGGVMTFFFGAREAHYLRKSTETAPPKG
jgi:hypothetical protein